MMQSVARRWAQLPATALLLACICLLTDVSSAAEDDFWESRFCGPGVPDSCIYASVVFDSMLVVGGTFPSVEGLTGTKLIAAWDGASWHDIGGGLDGGEYARVTTMLVWQGTLIVGGYFSTAGGTPIQSIAQWDGSSWHVLGTGIDLLVLALTEFEGDLIAGGAFTSAGGVAVSNIARWDGSNWSALSSGITGEGFYIVQALCEYNGRLFAGGGFNTAGGNAASNVAAWNGVSWSALGTGTNGPVYGMTGYDGELTVVGNFSAVGGISAPFVASWDDSQWSGIGLPGTQFIDSVYCATTFDGDLCVGGAFLSFGGSNAGNVARWTGSAWNAVGNRLIHGTAYTLSVFDSSLVAAGDFDEVSGQFATPPVEYTVSHIAQYAGDDWNPIGMGFDDTVWELAEYGGDLVAGGEFLQVADLVASLDGSRWLGIGSHNEITSNGSDGVFALQEYDGMLYAGGRFEVSASGSAILAEWRGSQWFYVAGGDGWIEDMVIWNGDLVVGGHFSSLNGATGNVATYNGSTWSSLATGVNGSVSVVLTFGSDLVVGGVFTQAGGVSANGVALWNGSNWSALGTGPGAVYAACVYNANLYVATADKLYRWDDPNWTLVEDLSTIGGSIKALTVHDNMLFAAGNFSEIGGIPANAIASFNESSWEALGGGFDLAGLVSVLVLRSYNGKLYVGGSFHAVGGKPSHYVAAWTKLGSCCEGLRGNINGSSDGDIDIADLTYMVAYMFKSGPPPTCYAEANVNGLGDIDIADLTFLVNYMFKSGSEPPVCP